MLIKYSKLISKITSDKFSQCIVCQEVINLPDVTMVTVTHLSVSLYLVKDISSQAHGLKLFKAFCHLNSYNMII